MFGRVFSIKRGIESGIERHGLARGVVIKRGLVDLRRNEGGMKFSLFNSKLDFGVGKKGIVREGQVSMNQERGYVFGKLKEPLMAEKVNRMRPLMNLVVLVCVVSVLGITVYAHGTHWLIENMLEETNENLDYETRRLLRAATYRKYIDPEPRVSMVYLNRAIENLEKLEKLDSTKPEVLEIYFKLADVNEAIAKYDESLKILSDVENVLSEVEDKFELIVKNNVKEKYGDEEGKLKGYRAVYGEWVCRSMIRAKLMEGRLFMYEGKSGEAQEKLTEVVGMLGKHEKWILDIQEAGKGLDIKDEVEELKRKVEGMKARATLSLGEAMVLKGEYERGERLLKASRDMFRVKETDRNTEKERGEGMAERIEEKINGEQKEETLSEWANNAATNFAKKHYTKYNIKEETGECMRGLAENQLAQLYIRAKRPEDAEEAAKRAVSETYGKEESVCGECAFQSLVILGKLAKKKDDLQKSVDYYNKALTLAVSLDLPGKDNVIKAIQECLV
ncbi:hypothetical protein BB558_002544 [Smittium angustum]|uniref:MalT-like TPR region domain-containing protein n=2 Tax=Smittium angustum TaxID=133377 RepID=A0A2U1J8J9_SMIAN|nr:hypothetical protein BB558_002544 [Smittium angustum]